MDGPAFDFEARTRDYSRKNAYWLARASLVAYDSEQAARSLMESWGLNSSSFRYFSRGDTQAFLAGNDDLLLLAFRGTENLRDWMTDLDVDLVGGPGGKVHEGFLAALLYVWRDVWRCIQTERRGRGLWVTGHSLGAALATLAVAKLRLEKDEPVNGLYTYGQPRTGDRDFAKSFDTDFEKQAFRYVNNNDIVTRVPFRLMHYSHIGTFKYFKANGDQDDDMSWWDKVVDRIRGRLDDLLEPGTDGLKDHELTKYIEYLGRARGLPS